MVKTLPDSVYEKRKLFLEKRVNKIIERTQQFEKERDEILSSIRSPSIVIQLQKNMFLNASRLVDMFQIRDWDISNKRKFGVSDQLCDFMSNAQKAEKFRMDQVNWSEKAIHDNLHCIQKHKKEGLGVLPFNKILFQTRFYNSPNVIYLNLFEYKNKDIENNAIKYDYRSIKVKNNSLSWNKLKKSTITIPIDFSKKNWGRVSPDHTAKKSVAMRSFLQLNSHTDKNTNIGVFDIKPKTDNGIGSFKVKGDNVDEKDFVPVWKSKTIYVRPEQYKPERDTTYTTDVEKNNDSEPRYVPYHSVRGHVRRLQKGDITSVRSHFRGRKEYGAIFKNYVLAQPRLFRKGKEIW